MNEIYVFVNVVVADISSNMSLTLIVEHLNARLTQNVLNVHVAVFVETKCCFVMIA